MEGTVMNRALGVLEIGMTGQHNRQRAGSGLLHPGQQLQAVSARHFDIADQQIYGLLLKNGNRLIHVLRQTDI